MAARWGIVIAALALAACSGPAGTAGSANGSPSGTGAGLLNDSTSGSASGSPGATSTSPSPSGDATATTGPQLAELLSQAMTATPGAKLRMFDLGNPKPVGTGQVSYSATNSSLTLLQQISKSPKKSVTVLRADGEDYLFIEEPGVPKVWIRITPPSAKAGSAAPKSNGDKLGSMVGTLRLFNDPGVMIRLVKVAGEVSIDPGRAGGHDYSFSLPAATLGSASLKGALPTWLTEGKTFMTPVKTGGFGLLIETDGKNRPTRVTLTIREWHGIDLTSSAEYTNWGPAIRIKTPTGRVVSSSVL